MADKKEKLPPMRELIHMTQWGKEKETNKRISLGLFGNTYYIQLAKYDGKGDKANFKDRKTLYFSNDLIEMTFAKAAQHMMRRIKSFEKGIDVPNQSPLIIYNGKNFKTSTSRAEFNVFRKDGEETVLVIVTLLKYKEGGEELDWKEQMWFGSATLYSKREEKTVEDQKTYAFFEQMYDTMKSCANRTNLTRDRYLANLLNEENKNKSNSSNNSKYNDDDDDDIF